MLSFDTDIIDKNRWKGAYIVGGSVRDRLLGRRPLDFDIAVFEDAKGFARRMAAQTNGRCVELGKEDYMIYRVIVDKMVFDIAPVNGASIKQDLKGRDFTINAMAYDVEKGEIIDCVEGRQDLNGQKIRMVSRSVFARDPVRLIRAYRLAATLKFEIEPRTASAICTDAALIANSAGERIRTELFKILECVDAHDYIIQMARSGLLFAVFPELAAMKGCIQNRYHRFDVFEHTLQALFYLEKILENPTVYLPNPTVAKFEWTPLHQAALLKYCILLHDIGKPVARTRASDGTVHFYGHGKKSAEMAEQISQRLKLSKQSADYTDFIVRNHLRPLFLFNSRQKEKISRRAITRFLMKCGTRTPDLMLHAWADINGKAAGGHQRNAAFTDFVQKILTDYYSDFTRRSEKPALITGTDLIEIFGLKPSPVFKKILKRVEEQRLCGNIETVDEAVAWVRDFLAGN
ncbi:MAG: HD domain-containing protein [Desulfobacterales bacterium]|jgi:putative nucleotidyltransferase with HDIG domain